MAHFKTNITVINATIAMFLCMNAIAPLFWAPFSERIGRRWVYIITMALFAVCSLICGLSNNIGVFFCFRLLQGIFSSAGQAIGGGSVTDLFEAQERGKAMSIYILGILLGPAVGPMLGGYIAQYLGWRWIFYIKAIIGVVLTTLNFLFVKETLYDPNAKDIPPAKSFKERLGRLKFNPFVSLRLLLQTEIALICVPMSISFGWFFLLVTLLAPTYSSVYNFSTGSIGLCFLAGGLGNCSGSVLAGILSDKLYVKSIKRNGGREMSELRLAPMYIALPFIGGGALMYGWFLYARLHWILPLLGYCLATFGIMFTVTISSTYLVDTNTHLSASIVSATNFTRNMCGMVLSLVAAEVRQGLGDQWTYTTMAIMSVTLYLVCIPPIQIYGERWRVGRRWWQKE
ncbi:major facilitator superfamily domain-containing protein [Pilobolus umbonatus]|nr:major facilitator superfamily domain-containing protein [Pilobolus umbonatus]